MGQMMSAVLRRIFLDARKRCRTVVQKSLYETASPNDHGISHIRNAIIYQLSKQTSCHPARAGTPFHGQQSAMRMASLAHSANQNDKPFAVRLMSTNPPKWQCIIHIYANPDNLLRLIPLRVRRRNPLISRHALYHGYSNRTSLYHLRLYRNWYLRVTRKVEINNLLHRCKKESSGKCCGIAVVHLRSLK